MRDRITSHLKKHELISSSQHGFVHKKLCVTNLLECHQVVLGLLNVNKSVDGRISKRLLTRYLIKNLLLNYTHTV